MVTDLVLRGRGVVAAASALVAMCSGGGAGTAAGAAGAVVGTGAPVSRAAFGGATRVRTGAGSGSTAGSSTPVDGSAPPSAARASGSSPLSDCPSVRCCGSRRTLIPATATYTRHATTTAHPVTTASLRLRPLSSTNTGRTVARGRAVVGDSAGESDPGCDTAIR